MALKPREHAQEGQKKSLPFRTRTRAGNTSNPGLDITPFWSRVVKTLGKTI